jgi:hypothetical protein
LLLCECPTPACKKRGPVDEACCSSHSWVIPALKALSDGDGDGVGLLFPRSVGKAMLLRIVSCTSYASDMDLLVEVVGVLGRCVSSGSSGRAGAIELLLWPSAQVLVSLALSRTSALGQFGGLRCGELLASPVMSPFRSVSVGIFPDGAELWRDDSNGCLLKDCTPARGCLAPEEPVQSPAVGLRSYSNTKWAHGGREKTAYVLY